MAVPEARAFSVSIHEEITVNGLSPPGQSFRFLREAVLDDIKDQHSQVDGGFSGARDERHFDDCEFNGGAEYIRDRFADAREELVDSDVWDATDEFGSALHPAMDIYAHSNWVEMGFPLTPDDPGTAVVDVARSDLLDLSGAQRSIGQRWFVDQVVRGDILLGNDDFTIPSGWSINPDGGGTHVPTLFDREDRLRGRLLVTGEGTFDDECDIYFFDEDPLSDDPPARAYDGLEHGVLNKDSPDGPKGRAAHAKARALATLQTGYEWCRLVHEASRVARAGMVLATWVRSGGNPHPAGTPCARSQRGPTRVVVTVSSVRVLDSGDDDDNDPGEIQLGVALYDDPQNFHRSVHATSRGGSVRLDDGERMPASRLPLPLTLCVPSGRGASFALYGWDNDDSGGLFANDFDDKDDDDELLVGFARRFGAELPTGMQVARSSDLEVRYRVTRGPSNVICRLEAEP